MARIPETINNGKRLDRLIDETLAAMQAKGAKSNVRKSVGGDPKGLVIQITPRGSASWILRTTWAGKQREYGLGSYRREGATSREAPAVSLSKARKKASEIVEAIASGANPIVTRQEAQKDKTTFRQCAARYIAKERSGWKNEKHAAQWDSTLVRWVYPKIGDLPIETIDLDAVEGVLVQPVADAGGKPLWLARHTTARRVRQRIEQVLDYAAAKKMRAEENNPARISGPLAKLLPKLSKQAKKVRNHASLPYAEIPEFWRTLQTMPGIGAQALQFTILTAARSGEVRHADWSEIDLDRALWIIPGEKMKAGEPHTVPLSTGALAVLARISGKRSGLIFPGAARDKDTGAPKPMSDMTLAAVLKRMKRNSITVHGFRSTFRTWADEQTAYSHRVKETALAHTISDETEGAYNRAKHVENRTKLMQEWCEYVTSAT